MAQNQSNPGWPFGFVPTAAQWAAAFSQKRDANPPNATGLAITLSASGDYTLTGSTARTWILPLLSSLNSPYDVFNGSTANLTIETSGEDVINFNGALVDEIVLAPGGSAHIVNFGTGVFWAAE